VTGREQLVELARPFPPALVSTRQGQGGSQQSYVAHDVVTQRLLHALGPFSQEVVGDPIRDAAGGYIVAVVLRLRVQVDGREVVVEEIGEVENPGKCTHDGDRLKKAVSDGIKRAAMRLGLGLHMWSGPQYFLHDMLVREDQAHAAGELDGAQ
jgi:hypothetical protein